MRRLTIMIFLALISLNVHASSLDLNINSDTFRMTFAKYSAKKTIVDFGAIFLDRNNQRDDGFGAHLGLNYDFRPLRLGLRLFYISPGATDVLALGVGGQISTYLARRVIIGGHLYYAPSALSFMDGDAYGDFEIRLAYKVSKPVRLYLGYRNLKIRLFDNTNKVEVDGGFHLGMKLFF